MRKELYERKGRQPFTQDMGYTFPRCLQPHCEHGTDEQGAKSFIQFSPMSPPQTHFEFGAENSICKNICHVNFILKSHNEPKGKCVQRSDPGTTGYRQQCPVYSLGCQDNPGRNKATAQMEFKELQGSSQWFSTLDHDCCISHTCERGVRSCTNAAGLNLSKRTSQGTKHPVDA